MGENLRTKHSVAATRPKKARKIAENWKCAGCDTPTNLHQREKFCKEQKESGFFKVSSKTCTIIDYYQYVKKEKRLWTSQAG